MSTLNNKNEWQSYINERLDENFDIEDVPTSSVLKSMGVYGNFNLDPTFNFSISICKEDKQLG